MANKDIFHFYLGIISSHFRSSTRTLETILQTTSRFSKSSPHESELKYLMEDVNSTIQIFECLFNTYVSIFKQ